MTTRGRLECTESVADVWDFVSMSNGVVVVSLCTNARPPAPTSVALHCLFKGFGFCCPVARKSALPPEMTAPLIGALLENTHQ
ncbi:MAG: hypothetical protein ACK41E_09960 [Deinococcales bacterium]